MKIAFKSEFLFPMDTSPSLTVSILPDGEEVQIISYPAEVTESSLLKRTYSSLL